MQHTSINPHTALRAFESDPKPPQWLALYFPQLASDPGVRFRFRCTTQSFKIEETSSASESDPDRAHNTLERLAAWCYQYSSQVCIVSQRNSLLIEVAASQRLFGAPETLAERIHTELEQLDYQVLSGTAPTPEAAQLAARHGLHIHTFADLRSSIGVLGIDSLHLQASQLQTLEKTGLRTIAEVLRLPRKALTRRLGPTVSDYLDRLLGQRPDPRKSFHPSDSFSAGMDVPETTHTQGLLFPIGRLVQELCGVLRARDRGIQALQVYLQLEGDQLGVRFKCSTHLSDFTQCSAHLSLTPIANHPSSINLTLSQVTRSEAHLMMLLRERLERLQLTSPVRHIQLRATRFLPFVAAQEDLLSASDTPSENAVSAVIERLQARLGTGAVKGLRGREDHRPEHSWSLRELNETATCTPLPQRPTWLLPKPQPCRIDAYRILAGPERIESGWWDGGDCRRDYFIVRDAHGRKLWAFHEYKPSPGWYLHGLFA